MTPTHNTNPKKRLIIIAGAAAAMLAFVAVIVFAIIPALRTGKEEDSKASIPSGAYTYMEPPVGREVPFSVSAAGFMTGDPAIKMIEVNQCLSYGFDSDTGDYYVMDSFVAGKETAVFIALDEPFDPGSEVKLTIERDGETVAAMASAEIIDDYTLLFHPRDMTEVANWAQGAYTFIFEMNGSIAIRTTNFYEAMPMKVLAIPIVGYYSGDIRRCQGDWKQGSTMITATFPVAREDVEYVLGPELDLSSPRYDLDTKEGRKKVWQELRSLQSANNGYTMIVGFMRTPTTQGFLGYTYGDIATVVCESELDLLATVVHEISHCYMIGDEYEGGSLNDFLNPPPYGTTGRDILSKDTVVAAKEKVISGFEYGLLGSGAVVYPEQRAYWPEGRELLGAVSSFMGGGTGADSFTFWVSSDIWNHLFEVFTGQSAKSELDIGTLPPGDDREAEDLEYWGQCYVCYGNVYTPDGFIICENCGGFALIGDGGYIVCGNCGAEYMASDFTVDDLWIYHPDCNTALYFPEFDNHNEKYRPMLGNTMTLEIIGDIDESGMFYPDLWYSFEAPISSLTTGMSGEYSAYVYDAGGHQLAMAYFDAVDGTQERTREGAERIVGTEIPVRVVLRFPEGAARVVIQKGDREIYSTTLSASTPEAAFTGLADGQQLTNKTTLTWDASDADGDELAYRVWYCRSDTEEYLLAGNITATTLNIDLTDYPGTDQGWFKILATDGVRTGVVTSPMVSVPYRAPDILNVIPEGKQFKVTDIVEIRGKVYDAQDGWLWDSGYEWYVDGRLWANYGNCYFVQAPYMLLPGMHTITLTATNSAGLSSTKDFTVEIIADESDLPDDWSHNDLTLALRLGFYLPLDRLDAPITRLEFAWLMFSFYSLVLPDDFDLMPETNIFCEFDDMSNDMNDMDYLIAWSMVSMGLMDVRDAEIEDYLGLGMLTYITGKFAPSEPITERDAMQCMYMTIELSRNQIVTVYEVMDESEFMPTLEEWGFFDEPDSPNTYRPEENLTKRLALVRIARFVKYEFEMDDKDYGVGAGFFDNYYSD